MALLKRDRVLALDIGASKLVLAEFGLLRDEGDLELLRYGVESLGPDSANESEQLAFIASGVKSLMRSMDIHPAPLVMSVSGQSVFPRYVKLPPVTSDKVEQIIRYEAEQNVPFPIKEVVWDYQLLDGEGDERNVMLVAVKIDAVRRLTDAVQAADLEPVIVDVAPMALYNAVRYNYPDLPACTMVLDIGARSSNLIFLQENRIFSRSIPVAGNAITQDIMKALDVSFEEAETLKCEHGFVAFGGVYAGADDETADRVSKVIRNVVTRLHAEVSRSINFYRSQQEGSPPSLVLLCGGSSVINHLDTFFREKLQVEVEYLNPFANVVVGEDIDTETIVDDMRVLGEVVGLGLRRALSCPVEINLMPPDLVARETLRRRQPYFAVAAAGVLGTLLAWWGYTARMGRVVSERVDEVKTRIAQFESTQTRLTDVSRERVAARARLESVAAPVVNRGRWLGLLEAVHESMVEGMWITGWKPEVREGTIARIELTVHGFTDRLQDTDEMTATERFREALRSQAVFAPTTEIVSEMVVGRGNYMRRFVINLVLAEPIEEDG